MKWLDELPYLALLGAAILLALMPFEPQPHLLEKYAMLMAGNLNKLLDIADVCWHLLPIFLLFIKLSRNILEEKT
ncbi:MAG: hypothetical protein R8K49_01365 [Mariprofundaceae bacterium]